MAAGPDKGEPNGGVVWGGEGRTCVRGGGGVCERGKRRDYWWLPSRIKGSLMVGGEEGGERGERGGYINRRYV